MYSYCLKVLLRIGNILIISKQLKHIPHWCIYVPNRQRKDIMCAGKILMFLEDWV